MSINFDLSQQLIDNISIGIYLLDLEGNIILTNDYIKKIVIENNVEQNYLIPTSYIIKNVNNNNYSDSFEIDLSGVLKKFMKNSWKVSELNNQKIIIGTIEDITEIKINKLKVLDGENKFNELFNSMAQGVVYHDKNGNIIDANPAALRILGLSIEQFKGESAKIPEWKVIYEDGSEYKQEDHPAMYTLRTGNPLFGALMGVYNLEKKDIIWILVSSSPRLIDINGKPEEVFVTFEDITDLRKWQIALSRSEERYRKLLNSASDFIFLKDSNYRYLMINTAYEEFLGITENEVVGRSDFELLPADIANNCYKSDQKALTTGSIVISYEAVYDKMYETQKFTVKLSDTEIGIGGIIKDVTDIYKTQKTIKENEEKYRLLVENQNDLIVKVDKEGRFLFVSPSYCKMFGKNENELLGNRFIPLVHPEDRDKTLREMEKLYSPPYNCYIEQRALTVNGWKWFGWLDKAITDIHGNVIEIIGNGRDITDKKYFEIELQKAKELAETSNKAKVEFLSEISHKISSPLQTILDSCNIINNKIKLSNNNEIIELFKNINYSSEKIIKITNNIQNLSELTLNVYKPKFGEIDLKKEILDVLITSYKLIAQNKGLLFKFESTLAKCILNIDTYSVIQIISNLLDNAIKFTHKGHIEVKLFKNDEKTCISISDTGIGIKPEFIPHLIESNLKDGDKKNKYFEENGLGLVLVKEYCKINNAIINVESIVGKGSTFTIIFNN
ncbi:MAG TPA: PAS domain-containing sensor histidine kinase [Melioribacteraceae bacterium]|nr:PAS domain-containing sensor histidine kinase [Melioribacteraceae bacterium]